MSAWNISYLPVMVTCIFFIIIFRVWYGSYRKETLWWVYSCDIESSNEPEELKGYLFPGLRKSWRSAYLQLCYWTAVLISRKISLPPPHPSPTLRWFIGLHIPLPFWKFFYICKFYIAQMILPYWRLNWWIFHLVFFSIVNKS